MRQDQEQVDHEGQPQRRTPSRVMHHQVLAPQNRTAHPAHRNSSDQGIQRNIASQRQTYLSSSSPSAPPPSSSSSAFFRPVHVQHSGQLSIARSVIAGWLNKSQRSKNSMSLQHSKHTAQTSSSVIANNSTTTNINSTISIPKSTSLLKKNLTSHQPLPDEILDTRDDVIINRVSPLNDDVIKNITRNNVSSSKVLLLSYQRSGSSMMGNLLFQQHDDMAFYLYEPLDALYSSLYGTEPGWNVPADITFDRTGNYREPPPQELKAVQEHLDQLFSCQFDNRPTEYLAHPFWFYFPNSTSSLRHYTTCLRKHSVASRSLHSCQLNLRWACGRRFNDVRAWRELCYSHLSTQHSDTSKWFQGNTPFNMLQLDLVGRPGWSVPQHADLWHVKGVPHRLLHGRPYLGYNVCIKGLAQRSRPCTVTLTKLCESRPVRAIKTVRATMSAVRPLLEKHPDLKVLHLLRDPRGAVRSRITASWSQGFYDTRDVGRIAKVYCLTAMKDIEVRKQLEKSFPGRILQIVFDHFLDNPMRKSQEILSFLNTSVLDGGRTVHWITEHIKTAVKEKWHTAFNQSEVEKIDSNCRQYLDIINNAS